MTQKRHKSHYVPCWLTPDMMLALGKIAAEKFNGKISPTVEYAVEKLIIMETQLQDVQSDVFRKFIHDYDLTNEWDLFISGTSLCDHVFDTGYEFEHDPDIHCTKCGFRP